MSDLGPRRPRYSRWEPLTVGIDIGGTKVLAAVVDPAGTVLAVDRRPTEGHDVRAVENTIVDLVQAFSRQYDVAAVGIGAAGFVDVTRTIVMFSPHLDWRREPLRARVAERVRLPVVVDNDANTAALAETRFGAGRGHRYVLCVTLGTGIGGALVLDQRVYRGANGMAGEFGHMQVVPDGHWCECGNRGCWEQYASGNALVRDARELVRSTSPMAHHLREMVGGDASRLQGPQITQAARDGDPLSIELLADVGRWLGVGLAGMAAAFDPGCIIIGGGLSDAGDLLIGPTRTAFSRSLTGRGHREEPVIVQAELGPNAGFIGAADMARSAARRSRRGRVRRTRSRRPRRTLLEILTEVPEREPRQP
jgi:glucokinase